MPLGLWAVSQLCVGHAACPGQTLQCRAEKQDQHPVNNCLQLIVLPENWGSHLEYKIEKHVPACGCWESQQLFAQIWATWSSALCSLASPSIAAVLKKCFPCDVCEGCMSLQEQR